MEGEGGAERALSRIQGAWRSLRKGSNNEPTPPATATNKTNKPSVLSAGTFHSRRIRELNLAKSGGALRGLNGNKPGENQTTPSTPTASQPPQGK